MNKIHWAGGLKLPRSRMLSGWPCCCSGQRAYDIRDAGTLTYARDQVTCKKCLSLLAKAEESS